MKGRIYVRPERNRPVNKPAVWRLCVGLFVVSVGAMACRGTDPSGDPKTPPNSPLPQVDKPEEPEAPMPNPLSDGGSSSSSGTKL